MKRMPWYYTVLAVPLSVLSGAAFAYSLPPREISLLGWIALLPFLVATRMVRPLIGAGCGMIAALATCGVLVGLPAGQYQIANSLTIFLGLALVFAVVGCLSSIVTKKTKPALWSLFVACAGVGGEWAVGYIAPASVALSQYRDTSALRIASYTGIWGVSFLIWLIPAAIIVIFTRKRFGWAMLIAAIVIIAAARIPERATDDTPRLAAAAVQAPGSYNAAEETEEAAKDAQVVVWAEHVLDPDDNLPIKSAKDNDVYVVVNFSEPNGRKKPFNTVSIISPGGKTLGFARKRHLYGAEVLNYTRGVSSSPIQCRGFKAGLCICLDTVFTDVVRDLARQGADIIFVPNSDPDLPHAALNHLHSAMVAFRAAENGVPIVWTDVQSLSTIYGRRGSIMARAPVGQVTWVSSRVKLRHGTTFYTRRGDFFAYGCAGAALSMLVIIIALSARKRSRAA